MCRAGILDKFFFPIIRTLTIPKNFPGHGNSEIQVTGIWQWQCTRAILLLNSRNTINQPSESRIKPQWQRLNAFKNSMTGTQKTNDLDRIILMKSRDRRALDFIRIILSFSSSPDFSTKNVKICDKYVIIWCHGGDHSKWNNFTVIPSFARGWLAA